MEVLQDLSPSALIDAIEANLSAYYIHLGSWSRVELYDGPDLLWGITDIPYPLFNTVLRARLAPEATDIAIEAAIARCRSRNVPMLWLVGPTSRPADLGQRLLAHGFVHRGDPAGMAVDLHTLNEDLTGPPGLIVRRVEDEAALREHWAIVAEVFAMPDFVADAFCDCISSLGLNRDPTLRFYIGWLEGRAVATAAMFLGAGVAGIYSVATIPEARRKGIGAAVTLMPLLEARAEGYRVGILHASKMGFPIYQRLGFREYCRIAHYYWLPPDGERE